MSRMAIIFDVNESGNKTSEYIHEKLEEDIFKVGGFKKIMQGFYVFESDTDILTHIYITLEKLKQHANAPDIGQIFVFEISGSINNMKSLI